MKKTEKVKSGKRASNVVNVTARRGFSWWRPVCLKAASIILKECDMEGAELSVLISGNSELRALNREFRNKDKATDVLSFPSGDDGFLGDIAVSIDKVREQAPLYGATRREEFLRLLTHGVLHLLGYDHEIGAVEARRMKKKEEEVLAVLTKAGKGGK